MKIRLLSISLSLLLALLVITPTDRTSGSANDIPFTKGISVNESLAIPDINSIEGPSQLESVSLDEEADQLYPADMDPITTCQASLGGPFGSDVEIFMGGDVGYWVDLIPEWGGVDATITPTASSNISAASAGSENIVAVWKDFDDNVWFDLWQTSETYSNGAWVGSIDLGFQADGNPTIIAKSEYQWEVYARQGTNIFTTILTDTFRTTSSPWVPIKGVNNAASDPVVVTVNPSHTVIFYLDGTGRAWLTEWTGGWEWRDEPIALVDHWPIYLPIVRAAQPETRGNAEITIPPSVGSGILQETQNFQVLSAVSRNDNNLALFGVDADNQLWVREWTRSSIEDWSNTHWVKLKEGVAIEKPGVASRHSLHIGVAVRDTSGDPTYLEWTIETGWATPAPLPLPADSNLSSGFTLVAVAPDAYWLFGVDQNGQVRELSWSEDAGWGEWASIDSLMNSDQTLAIPVRRFMDMMVLGRDPVGEVNSIHFTSQGGEATSTVLVPQESSPILPRGQALAWVNGNVLHVAGRQSTLGPPYFWEVEAREMVGTAPLTGTLLLVNHDFLNDNVISLATGDLDYDGNDEAVIATRSADSSGNATMVSVLDIGLDSSLDISRLAYTEIITDYVDISLAIQDLDGNGRQDEIVLTASYSAYYGGVDGFVYRYLSETQELVQIYQGNLLSGAWRDYEVEIAVGRLYPRDPDHADPSQQYLGEQLIVLITDENPFLNDMGSELKIYTMITGTWELENVDTFYFAAFPWGRVLYRSALDAGDLNGDGFDEIAAWYGNIVSIIDPRSRQVETETYDPIHDPNNGQALSVGDIDLDGRAEILAGSQRYLSIYEILGDNHLVRTKWQQWDPSWGTATAVLAGDLDHDTFASKLVGCKTFREARVAVVINGAPRWYGPDNKPIQDSSGSFSISKGGSYNNETGTNHSFGTSLEIGCEQSVSVPFGGEIGFRASVIMDYLRTVGQTTSRETEQIYGTDYTFDDTSLGLVILNVRSYTCNYYDLYSPDNPEAISKAMICNPGQHGKQFHSLDWWLTSGKLGDFEHSWAEVGHRSPSGVHTNSLDEPHNYAGSLPYDYRVVYNWSGDDIPEICGDQQPKSVVWWAEDAAGYSEGTEVSVEENTSISTGWSAFGFGMDLTNSFGDGWNSSETYGWMQTVGFSGGVTQFYDDPNDPDDNRPCYKIVPYVYQPRAQTLGGFTYPYLELDYYVVCIGCGGVQTIPRSPDAVLPR